jgi:REP element-mobilizing transposase RayT
MGWKIRLRGENLYHHIYAWGNDRHSVFRDPKHYQKYLLLIAKYLKDYNVDIIAYALMEWHVHLFVHDKVNTISEFMMALHGDYAQYFNKQTNRVGHVFGERFNNKLVTNDIYGKWLTRYIHQQAVEVRLVTDPADYQWTSYKAYIGLDKKSFIVMADILAQFGEGRSAIEQYRDFVQGDDDGPVDWSKPTIKKINPQCLLENICKELHIHHKILMQPDGRAERKKRHEAIYMLYKKYGLTITQIAKILNLSYCSVRKAMSTITGE